MSSVETLEASATSPSNPEAQASWDHLRRYGARVARSALLIALGLEVLIFFLLSSDFLTVENFRDIAVQNAVVGIVAVPTALLLLMGYIDLSIGSILALSAVVTGTLITNDVSPVIAGLAGIGVGLCIGAFNGALVCFLGFSTIIVTLGMLTAIRGVAIQSSQQTPVGFGETFATLGNGTLLTIPVPIVILAVVFALGGLFLRYSIWGRHVYAIGVNKEAAFLSGVSVRRIPFLMFAVTGLATGLGGVILASRIDAAPGGSIGNGFELSVLTAVLLGGVAFEGGRGNIFGVLLGVAFVAILQNGLTLLNVPTTTSLIAQGAVLVVAAALAHLSARQG